MNKTRNGISWRDACRMGSEIIRERKIVRVKEYDLNPTRCKVCGKPFKYEKRKNKFCSHSCAASFNNLGRLRSGLYSKKPCIVCGKITKNTKYCSNACCGKFERLEAVKRISLSGDLGDRRNRWYLEETRGRKCESCGLSKWLETPIPLDIHHKDGNSDNNKLENLEMICPNCHRTTQNHGSKNRGSGRYSKRKIYRNKRYEIGLSY